MATEYQRDIGSVQLQVRFGVERGLDVAHLLRGSRIQVAQLEDPLGMIEPAQELLVVGNLVEALPQEPLLGLQVGEKYTVTSYGQWGLAVLSSETVGEAIERALRFLPLTYVFCSVSSGTLAGQSALLFSPPETSAGIQNFVLLRDMVAAIKLIVSLSPQYPALDALVFGEHWPEAMRQQVQQRLGVPVRLKSNRYALVLKDGALTSSLPFGNRFTSTASEQICMQLMEQRQSKEGVLHSAKKYLQMSQGRLSLPELAARMCLSERTLRRKLQQQGTCFSRLDAEVKMALAAQMLADKQLSIAKIADTLGYGDQSCFSQAFKRWYGVAPSQLKQSHGALDV